MPKTRGVIYIMFKLGNLVMYRMLLLAWQFSTSTLDTELCAPGSFYHLENVFATSSKRNMPCFWPMHIAFEWIVMDDGQCCMWNRYSSSAFGVVESEYSGQMSGSFGVHYKGAALTFCILTFFHIQLHWRPHGQDLGISLNILEVPKCMQWFSKLAFWPLFSGDCHFELGCTVQV